MSLVDLGRVPFTVPFTMTFTVPFTVPFSVPFTVPFVVPKITLAFNQMSFTGWREAGRVLVSMRGSGVNLLLRQQPQKARLFYNICLKNSQAF